ncbi:alpha/beta fold hydrolase [Conexibacter sp. CPCC 206217]|uniref:alpha/beta fold hydrolase n=1 Tax=Conexibacter sp. CPCC 206217 TaxID=3064574 RepID=UPI00271922B0|nr:alpha/beta fold hydrolase [Conexibacter sp. CPCC 206217]MDO8211828.1 alpha/beta fold hydrolase [Conexibacter sp. CPCC 206217]
MDAKRWPRGLAALAAAVALAVLCTFAAGASAAKLDLQRCSRAKHDPTRCGRLSVPLDRSGGVRGRVSLKVRVLPSRTRRANGTIFALAGGPGQAAAPLIMPIAQMLGPVLKTRRLVAFDQRGTGGSGRLSCPGLARTVTDAAVERAVAGCAKRLGERRIAYTSAASVEDIEAVRAALGIDTIVIYGVSYGTKVALDYAARHPQHVSRLVLDSLLLPSGSDPFMRTTIASIPRVLKQLCADRGCRFTRDPTADLQRLVARIARNGPLHGIRYDGRGVGRRIAIRREDLLSLLMAGDFDPLSRALFPGAVRAALDGDTALLARLLGADGGADLDPVSDSQALFVATSCEDGGVPWPAGTPRDERAAATRAALLTIPQRDLAPFDRATLARSQIGYCAGWPESPIAQPTAPLPDLPTLILSGDDDLRTPRSDALTLVAQMPSAQLVTVPEAGHSVLGADVSGCAAKALRRFFQGRRPRDCTYRPPRLLEAAAPPPTRLSALPRFRGLPLRAGRTLTAVNLTFGQLASDLLFGIFQTALGEDPGRAFAIAFGGLRGGHVRFTKRALTIAGYSYIPGVTLNARVAVDDDPDAPLVMRIGGAAAAHGTLRFTQTRITGTLGGHRISVRVSDGGSGEPRAEAGSSAAADPRVAAAALRSPVSRATLREALARARRLAGSPLGELPLPVVPPGALR